MWPFSERTHTVLGVRSTARFRGICWKRGHRVLVGGSERAGRRICRNHLLWAEGTIRDFVIAEISDNTHFCAR